MRLNAVKILKISITTDPKEKILEFIEKYLSKNPKSEIRNPKFKAKPLVIVTPNAEQIVYAQDNEHFAGILNQADVAIPDGIGIVVASRLLNIKNQKSKIKYELQRIPGVEMMGDLVKMAAKRGFPVALIGGRGGVAVEALECLKARYPGLVGWVGEPEDYNHYNDYNYYNCYKKIKETRTRLVFVGLGAPKQEYLMERIVHRALCTVYPLVLMSVGGSFDMIAGRVKRAPFALRALGLEWLWRLARQPWRWRRQVALIEFLWLVIREKGR